MRGSNLFVRRFSDTLEQQVTHTIPRSLYKLTLLGIGG